MPGLAMYILIGRTKNYAWSLTSANHDVRDVFAEKLCNPDGSAPTRASTHYLFKGKCRALHELRRRPARPASRCATRPPCTGPVIGTATVSGKPYALSRRRSTFGRDGLNLGALNDMTDGKATTPKRFFRAANQFGFTFNWAYASRKATAYFTSGLLPKRARGLDRRLLTLGTGKYEWRAILSERPAPAQRRAAPAVCCSTGTTSRRRASCTATTRPSGRCTGSSSSTGSPSGSGSRTWSSVMNRAATEDVRVPGVAVGEPRASHRHGAERLATSRSWTCSTTGSGVTRRGSTPTTTASTTRPVRPSWTACGSPMAEAVMRPVFGDLVDDARQRPRPGRPRPGSPTWTRTSARCSGAACAASST